MVNAEGSRILWRLLGADIDEERMLDEVLLVQVGWLIDGRYVVR